MDNAEKVTASSAKSNAGEGDSEKGAKKRREIGGSIPYTQSIGVLERAISKLIISERPESFSRDFMSTVLDVSGGASMPIIPILKRAGLLDPGGHPTTLYEDFQGDSTRPNAALTAMRNAFDDIFQRNKFAHRADADKIKDIIRSVTGLPKNDRIVAWMYNTFHAFQKYADGAAEGEERAASEHVSGDGGAIGVVEQRGRIGLSYNINIILPNTTNIETYNKIFRSTRENLLGN